MTLRELPIGKEATVTSVGGEGALRQHFLDMGVNQNGCLTIIGETTCNPIQIISFSLMGMGDVCHPIMRAKIYERYLEIN